MRVEWRVGSDITSYDLDFGHYVYIYAYINIYYDYACWRLSTVCLMLALAGKATGSAPDSVCYWVRT
jgi:hypothetical protein